MKKKILMLLALLTPTIVNASDFIACGNDKKIPVVITTIISTLFVIIRIIIPLIFVITGMISFFKATIANKVEEDLKKAKDKLINNIIAAVIIFFIISIVNFVISLAAGKNNSITSCINCMIHPNKCQKIEENIDKLCPGLISDQANYDENCNYIGDQKERVDYSTGKNGIQEYTDTKTGNNGNRTLRDNPDALTNQNLIFKTNGIYNYYLYVPKKVDSSKALIVYLHGNGQQADANPNRGIKETLEEDLSFLYQINHGMEFNCYVLIPQAPTLKWDTSNLKDLIDYEVEQNGIDKKRINLVGFSWGANSLPTIATEIPHYFASISAVSISKDFSYITEKPFEDVATYFFQGGNDNHSSLSKPYYDTLKKLNYNTNFKFYPGQAHGGFVGEVLKDTNFNNENNTNKKYSTFMDWVLDQRRTD